MLEPDDRSSGASPHVLRNGPLERAKKSRARTRALLVRTTIVSGLGLVAFGALFGLRRGAPAEVAHLPIDGGAASVGDAARSVPTVTLRGRRVLLDGGEVDTTAAIVDGGQVQRLYGLLEALKRRRQERDPRERSAIIDAAADTPAIVVKSVFQTVLLAGYPDVSFAPLGAGAP